MSARPPSRPPELPGYRYESLLGSGGFADVFLYQQQRPRRRVAIKVLLADVADEEARTRFDAEADLMAALSSHPSIVTIHHADVSADGRPFIVMEYCSRPSYGARFRGERIPVPEALRVGVQVAGAVETAHRAGILHRDIKPANVLVTDYNRAALTDFGISVVARRGEEIPEAAAISVPWSAPEAFADTPRADTRTDVFSLAATIHTLLAGRTPFEEPGGGNSASEVIERIVHQALTPLERPDVPVSLSRALAQGMAKDADARHPSALALGRALQQVEAELGLPVTPMDILEERDPGRADAEPDTSVPHTRIRAVATPRTAREDPESEAGSIAGDARTSPPAPSAVTPAISEPAAPSADPWAGIAPARTAHPSGNGPSGTGPGGPGTSTARLGRAPVSEATVQRPAGAGLPRTPGSRAPLGESAPGAAMAGSPGSGDAAAPDDDEVRASRRRVPPWLVLLLVGVLVLALGAGSVIAVRHYFSPRRTPPPTVAESTAVVGDAPLGKPSDLSVTRLDIPGATVAKAQIRWKAPDGFGPEDHYEVRWDVQGADYAVYRTVKIVKGRESTVRDMPPAAAGQQACVLVTAVREDGTAGEPERSCTG